jgi:hypothetical protein
MGMRLCLGREASRKVDNGFANKFGTGLGEDNNRIGWTTCVFAQRLTEFGFNVALQGFADINLFSADLVTHGISSSLAYTTIEKHSRVNAAGMMVCGIR